MNEEKQSELERLQRVLTVARNNGNQLFIQNIEREIAALERGDCSPLLEEYLTRKSWTPFSPERISRLAGRPHRCLEVQTLSQRALVPEPALLTFCEPNKGPLQAESHLWPLRGTPSDD